MNETASPQRAVWTWIAALVGVFMVAIDTLVVTNALPVIRVDLHAGLPDLEWTVNAYTLTFAVFLLSAASLADRFGRRRVFAIGMLVFTAASAAAAAAPDVETLIAARAVQGLGAAVVLPLTLTLLTSVVPPEKRGHAFGIWGAMVGLGVALGPVIGGSITQYWSWNWIFWINVPVGVLLLPMLLRVRESRGGAGRLDVIGTLVVTVGLLGIVYGLIRSEGSGWSDPLTVVAVGGGALLVLLFLVWEGRTRAPMLPLGLFRDRGFSLSAAIALIMPFGMFGSVFFGAQYLQTVLGYGPLEAGVRTLPWTAMPMIAAPVSGVLTERLGGRPLLIVGLALQTAGIGWLAAVEGTHTAYWHLVPPFVLAGVGMGLFLPAIARVAIGSAPANMEGVASGVTNALRQLGTVLGVTTLATIFAHYGGYLTKDSFVDGMVPAHYVGAAVLGVGTLLAVLLPGRRPVEQQSETSPVGVADPALTR